MAHWSVPTSAVALYAARLVWYAPDGENIGNALPVLNQTLPSDAIALPDEEFRKILGL